MTGKEKADSLALLKEVLSISSVNGTDGEGLLASYLQQYLNSCNIEAVLQTVDEKRKNLIADIEGENINETIIWNGHLDTVPYGSRKEWKADPGMAVAREGKVYARGASDMKSGLAAMAAALCQMEKSGRRPRCNIRFIATCDEEKGGLGASKVIEENSLGKPTAIIIGEPTDCRIGIAQKGCLWLKVTVSGRACHGAYPQEGINAIQYGFEICRELKTFVRQFSHPLLNEATAEITSIKGGIAPNMLPDTCEIIMDIRVTPNLSAAIVLKKLDEICHRFENEKEGKLGTHCEILNNRMAIEISEEHHQVNALKQAILKHGASAEVIGINYFTDASILAQGNKDVAVLLFGPGCPQMAHKPNEYVAVGQYYRSIEVLKTFCYSNDKDCI